MFRYIKNCLLSHKYSNFFMIAAFTIAVFSLYVGISMYEKMQIMIEEKNEFQYVNQVSIMMSNYTGETLNMSELLRDCTADVKLEDYGIYVNKAKATYLSEVYLNRTEQIPYPLIWGNWNFTAENSVVVGKALLAYAEEKEGEKYLTINGEAYQIVGITGSDITDILDYIIILDYFSLPSEEKERIDGLQLCNLVLGTNNGTLGENIDIFKNIAQLHPEIYMEQNYNEVSSLYITSDTENRIYYFLIYLFAMGICVIASEFWVYQRVHEIIICKTYGMDTDGIIERYLKEFFVVMSFGIVIGGSGAAVFIRNMFGMKRMEWEYFALSVCLFFLSVIISFVIPMIYIKWKTPGELVAEGDFT